MHVCVYGVCEEFMGVLVYIYVCACSRSQRASLIALVSFFSNRLSTNPGAHKHGWVGWSLSLRALPVSSPSMPELEIHAISPGLYVVLGSSVLE